MMVESKYGKRFTPEFTPKWAFIGVKDNITGELLGIMDTIDLLNELTGTNESLNQTIQSINFPRSKLNEKIKKLEDENKELKEDKDRLEDQLGCARIVRRAIEKSMIKKQEELDIYKVAVLDLVGSLAEKGIIVSGVKDEE